jgi:citronellol/citronellal dehydrogenase
MTPNALDGRAALITGTSRGIGRALALHLADLGVSVVSTGKTVEPRDDLPGTIVETAAEIRDAGGDAIWCRVDVRDEASVERAVADAVEAFGGLDVVVNNAGAIHLAPFEETPAKRFDLLTDVNVRGAYVTTRAALPHLKESDHAHVLSLSPPITDPARPGMAAYAVSKYGMTVLVQSLAAELADDGVAANSLWPVAAVESEATRHFGLGTEADWRRPEVVCDAVEAVLRRDPADCTGNAFYDEAVLREEGVEDFSRYNVVEGADPGPASARLFDPDFERPA